LREVRRYYARIASPEIADKLLRAIDQATGRIAERPLARRSREELMPGLRSALAHPYTIFFRIRDDDVEIVRVLHEARDFPTAFAKDQE
jgi:toxin ParE1/3/4